MRNPFWLVASLLILILFNRCNPADKIPPPNILWIVSEDNGTFLRCYGDSLATTPNLDKLAKHGLLFVNAHANAPVCAPARATLITGMYPTSLGLENMRSKYPVPNFVKFYPDYLKRAGYYTTNNDKKDYNTVDQPDVWDESGKKASYENRQPDQPFFHIVNLMTTHESRLHKGSVATHHDPKEVNIPPYFPDTREVRNDWAVYYDRIKEMDEQVGNILNQLEEDGLTEETIVFYYSDHGGAFARSKRFLFESGLRVPLIVRVPEKYQHLSPWKQGTKVKELVSFVDFAPTLLSLTGIEIPDHIQGNSFLGKNPAESRPYNFSFRGRMDERIDLSRSVTNGEFRYTRNFLPHRPYAQYIGYQWKAPSMRSWENEFLAGRLNSTQEAFFLPKPYEELYHLKSDPHCINNLIDSSQFQEIRNELSNALDIWQIKTNDTGLVPEITLENWAMRGSPYAFAQDSLKTKEVLEIAKMSASGKSENLDSLIELSIHNNPIIRYWAILGMVILKDTTSENVLKNCLKDEYPAASIAAAEGLYLLGEKEESIAHLIQMLTHEQMMVRLAALNVLDIIGEDAKVAIPTIKKIIQPTDGEVYDYWAMQGLIDKFEN